MRQSREPASFQLHLGLCKSPLGVEKLSCSPGWGALWTLRRSQIFPASHTNLECTMSHSQFPDENNNLKRLGAKVCGFQLRWLKNTLIIHHYRSISSQKSWRLGCVTVTAFKFFFVDHSLTRKGINLYSLIKMRLALCNFLHFLKIPKIIVARQWF